MAWTHGLLSVRRHGFDFDCIMYGLKCLIAAAMPNASISHGSHVTWCFFSLALKKPARQVCPFRETYSVDPMPCWVTEPSVTIHNWSLGRVNVFWATRKASRVLYAQCNTSCDFLSAMHDSRGDSTLEQCGMTRSNTLYAPMKERSPWRVYGCTHDDRVAMR